MLIVIKIYLVFLYNNCCYFNALNLFVSVSLQVYVAVYYDFLLNLNI